MELDKQADRQTSTIIQKDFERDIRIKMCMTLTLTYILTWDKYKYKYKYANRQNINNSISCFKPILMFSVSLIIHTIFEIEMNTASTFVFNMV